MFRSPFMAIFREVFYEGYFTQTSKTIYKYKTFSFKYVIQKYFNIYFPSYFIEIDHYNQQPKTN
jgi:hypothetical protein